MAKTKAQQLAHELNGVLGAGTVRMGSDPSLVVKFVPTGILPIDVHLQGGLPRGRFTEIFGDYSTLKSYIGLSVIAEAQRAGGIAALVDTEHAFDPGWATSLGVDVDNLIYKTPSTGEEAVDISEFLIRSRVDVLVWDSVAATVPQTLASKRMSNETVQPARLAALMSEASRKLTTANSSTAVLFINQTRINVGQMFGSPEVTPGGKAMGFYASYRIALRKAGKLSNPINVYGSDGKKESVKEVYAHKIKMVLEKSKLNKPHRETMLTFDLRTGRIDEVGFMISHGLETGLVNHEGQSWWLKGSTTKVRGLEKFRDSLTAAQLDRLRRGCLGLPEPVKKKVVKRSGASSKQ